MLMRFINKVRNRFSGEENSAIPMAQDMRYRNYQIGVGTHGAPQIDFYDAGATLKIGNYCSIAPDVTILLGGEHHHDWVSNYPFSLMFGDARDLPGYPFTKGDIVIGSDVRIDCGAVILSGVTIGDGAVITERSLVSKDVAPYSIVGGVPAKHIDYRFPPPVIESLQKIAWWNWSDRKIRAEWDLLRSPNIEEFIAKHLPEAGIKFSTVGAEQ